MSLESHIESHMETVHRWKGELQTTKEWSLKRLHEDDHIRGNVRRAQDPEFYLDSFLTPHPLEGLA